MKKITLSTFRKVADAEERLIRSTMPRTSEADPTPLWVETNRPTGARKTLTFKLGDVARVNLRG